MRCCGTGRNGIIAVRIHACEVHVVALHGTQGGQQALQRGDGGSTGGIRAHRGHRRYGRLLLHARGRRWRARSGNQPSKHAHACARARTNRRDVCLRNCAAALLRGRLAVRGTKALAAACEQPARQEQLDTARRHFHYYLTCASSSPGVRVWRRARQAGTRFGQQLVQALKTTGTIPVFCARCPPAGQACAVCRVPSALCSLPCAVCRVPCVGKNSPVCGGDGGCARPSSF